jgi:hypothetical protein
VDLDSNTSFNVSRSSVSCFRLQLTLQSFSCATFHLHPTSGSVFHHVAMFTISYHRAFFFGVTPRAHSIRTTSLHPQRIYYIFYAPASWHLHTHSHQAWQPLQSHLLQRPWSISKTCQSRQYRFRHRQLLLLRACPTVQMRYVQASSRQLQERY